MTEELKISDEDYIKKWRSMLSVFKAIDPQTADAKQQLTELIEAAKNTDFLTPRQKEGIIARCKNQMNGTYGNTKKPEHLLHGKPEKSK